MTVHEQIAYLDQAAASPAGRSYKAALLAALELRPGDRVLDVGCGPGTDLTALARAVGTTGRVIGVDRDRTMARHARDRTAAAGNVEIWQGDAHDLPLRPATVTRARADRVLMHLADPARAVRDMRRVLRPGGLIALAEPDWDTLVIDDRDTATSRAYTRYVAEHVMRHATIGRQLARLLAEAGLTVEAVTATPVVYRDYEAAEAVLRMPSVARRAWEAGALDERTARAWLERLSRGPFLAAFMLFTATARAS